MSTGSAQQSWAKRRTAIWAVGPVGLTGDTIRQRVARILALPAVVVLTLLGLVATDLIQDYRESRATARKVQLALAVQNMVHELQTERGVTAGILGGNPSFRDELAPARQLVDRQRTRVQNLLTSRGPSQEQARSALQQLDGLTAVRSATDSATFGRQAMFAYYTDRITALSVVDLGLQRTSDDELRREASALRTLQDLSEALAQERAFLNGVFSAGGFGKGEFVQFAAMCAAKESALARFAQLATPTEKAAADFVFATGAGRITEYFEQIAMNAADGRHIIVNPQSWWSGLTTVLDDLGQLQQHIGSVVRVQAHDLQRDSAQRIAGLLLIVLLTSVGSIYVAALASRSIARPLAALAAEANDVAAGQLPTAVSRVQAGALEVAPPEPPTPVRIPDHATAEIRSVAAALDRLQTAAYDLAIDQALQRHRTIESLANLGRRNQNLIRRQLGFITALEHEEIDPSALANLFELDHLATRMRRNAASLLVLVGASSQRQWSSAVPVTDLVRAAVSEVEAYRRVALRRMDDALVIGTAVGSLTHLLSELIENGLTFSPPDTEVEIQGRRLADGYLIAITDQGVGMEPEDLLQANGRLRGEQDFMATPTRFLGHFVVGQLSRETGAQVELLPSPVTGITARVILPQSLLASPLAVQAPDVPRHPTPLPEPRAQLTSIPAQVQPGISGPIALPPTGPPPAAAPLPPAEPLPAAAERAEQSTGSRLPAALSGILDRHPLIHPFAGNLTVSAPNEDHQPRPPSAPGPTPGDPVGAAGTAGGAPLVSGDHDVPRTRNGLRKRLPRDRRPSQTPATRPALQGTAPTAATQPTVNFSPAKVRARLTALRAGTQRGQVPETVTPLRASSSDHVVEDPE